MPDFEEIYQSVVAAESGADSSTAPPPATSGESSLAGTGADITANAADETTLEQQAEQPVAPPVSQTANEFYLDDKFFEGLDDEVEQPDAPGETALPTLERFASVTDPAERAELERLIAAANNAQTQFAPLAQSFEAVGGAENAGKLLEILGLGMLGDTPAYTPDGQPLGVTNLQWAVKQLDMVNREFFDGFVGQALKYAPELAYQNLPTLLEALETDKHLPEEVKNKVNEYLDQYAQRKGYELSIDAETRQEMLGQLRPQEQQLFQALSPEDQKAITETFRDFGMQRAMREFENSAYRHQIEQQNKQARELATFEQQFDEGFKGYGTFSQHLEGLHNSYVQKLVQQGIDEVRAEGLVAMAYKSLNKSYYDKASQEHQVMMELQQAMLPKHLRHPKYQNVAGTPLERKNLETAMRRVFKAQLDKAVQKYRRPSAPAAAPGAPGQQPRAPQNLQPPTAERQFEPEQPPGNDGAFVPTTASDIERMINSAMAQYR